jgi:polar amino acid transport system permease protein
MAESYSDTSSVTERTADERLLNDTTLKWAGRLVAGVFTVGVLVFLGYILLYRVDPDLLVEVVHPQFVDAFVTVIRIVVVSSVLSVVAGVFVGLGRVSKTPFTNSIATAYVEFFRGTPLLFQLMVIFLGVPSLWPPGEFPISDFRFMAAVIGLTLNHAAYIGEAIRGGITAVPDGQMEAARSLGMSYVQSMREVVLPQAWRNALAAIGNDQVILVKDTSLLTIIAVPELISAFRNVNSTNFDAWTPIVIVAVAYLLITIPLGKTVRYLESRADWGGEHE